MKRFLTDQVDINRMENFCYLKEFLLFVLHSEIYVKVQSCKRLPLLRALAKSLNGSNVCMKHEMNVSCQTAVQMSFHHLSCLGLICAK